MDSDQPCTECARTPCTACSWTRWEQDHCRYKSHLRLVYGASSRGVWSIGSKYFLHDRESDPPDRDPQNTRFLQTHTTIPVSRTVMEWKEPGDRCIRVTERVEGITLAEAWPKLSDDEKHDIAKQTGSYLAQLRDLHSSQIESLDHGGVYDSILFAGGYGVPHGPLKSDDELWDAMAGGIKKLDEGVQQDMRNRLPKATPYTFTHGDLSIGNIMVKEGKVTGIIDWERSGYMPRWWEYTRTLRGESEEDAEWKALLRENMDIHKDAEWFWSICYALQNYPKLNDNGIKILAAIEDAARGKGPGLEEGQEF